jgi:ketosteroid isomerase-like protein
MLRRSFQLEGFLMQATQPDIIAANLAAVEAHFHNEATGEVERAVDLYTDDAVWESPGRGLIFRGKEATAANYRRMFGSMRNVEFRPVQRFATADRVVDDSIVTFDLVGDGVVNAPLPVGSSVELRLVHIFEMRDGKISKETAFEMWRPKP